jgi:hypothetical protein
MILGAVAQFHRWGASAQGGEAAGVLLCERGDAERRGRTAAGARVPACSCERETERERESPREREKKEGAWRPGAAPGGLLGLKAASRRWQGVSPAQDTQVLGGRRYRAFCKKPPGFMRIF